jgi:hypothetical protein
VLSVPPLAWFTPRVGGGSAFFVRPLDHMKMTKLSIRTTALVSIAIFLFHLGILCSSLLKLNSKVWSVYQNYDEALDLFFLAVYCLTFIISLAVLFLADAPLKDRIFYSLMLFLPYFVISFIACIIVCLIYGSRVN